MSPGLRLRGRLLVPAVLAWVVAEQLAAQARPRLVPSARVRLTLAERTGRPPLLGRLVLFEPDAVTIVPRGRVRTRRFLLHELERLEVSAGQDPWLRYGGLLLGTAIGTAVGLRVLGDDERCLGRPPDAPGCRWETAPVLVGAGGGFILSGIAVALLLPERWRRVPLGPSGPR